MFEYNLYDHSCTYHGLVKSDRELYEGQYINYYGNLLQVIEVDDRMHRVYTERISVLATLTAIEEAE